MQIRKLFDFLLILPVGLIRDIAFTLNTFIVNILGHHECSYIITKEDRTDRTDNNFKGKLSGPAK